MTVVPGTPSLSRLLKNKGKSSQQPQAAVGKPVPAYCATGAPYSATSKASKEEDEELRREEESQLQKALAASVQEVNQKGKGKAPQRSSSTDTEELELALALSASEAENNRRHLRFLSLEEDEFDDATQFEELNRLQSHRLSLFDQHDTSSLSIITERTEMSSSAATTPMADAEEAGLVAPSYFGLWLSPDAKGVLDTSNHNGMAILPPLSQMMQERPPLPPRKPRPLPPLPQPTPDQESSEDQMIPLIIDSGSSASSFRSSMPRTVTTGGRSTFSFDTAVSHPSEDMSLTSEESYFTGPEDTPPLDLNTSAQTLGASAPPDHQLQPGSKATSLIQQRSKPLPPGAGRDLRAYGAYALDPEDDLQLPQVVEYGFLGPGAKDLSHSFPIEAFPDVIQLSNVPNPGEERSEAAVFAMDALTWSDMLRFLNWHGDTVVQAHPRDIASEKYGNGETELAAQFLPNPKGSGKVVRISIRLLPPNPHARRPDGQASSSRLLQSPGLNRQSTNAMSLPDHLILPVKLSEVAAMLSTLRHLAFIAAATSPVTGTKKSSGFTTVHTLRALGLQIAELSHENTRDSEKGDRTRLRDKFKMKFGRS